MMMENRDDLILKNTKLIYYVLSKLNVFDKSEELYDIGMIGLVKAANTYDYSSGYTFTTYAYTVIRHEITKYVTLECNNVRKANYNTISLYITAVNDNDCKIMLEETIPSDFNMEADLIYKEDVRKLYEALEKLPIKYKYVLIYRYGLYGKDKKKQEELAKILNVSKTTIGNYTRRGVELLRILMEEDT